MSAFSNVQDLSNRVRVERLRRVLLILISWKERASSRRLMRESGASQHATERFLRGEPVHPGTRERLERVGEVH